MHISQPLSALHRLIFKERNVGLLRPILHEIHSIYSKASGISAGNMTDGAIDLPSGKAISPTGAAHCLLEIARTSKFLCGIYQAVTQLKRDFNNTPIKILYAGCGPYATLVTPLTAMFSSQEVRFDLMDINDVSLNAAQKMYKELNLTAYVESYVKADATTYTIPLGSQPHLIISETMNAALKNEPQVDIMLNLIPQLREKGLFLPQQISVDAYLLNIGKETEGFLVGAAQPKRSFIGNVYTLSQFNCIRHQPTTFALPADTKGNNTLSLLTEITVFGHEKLKIYDCSLTLPQTVCKIDERDKQKAVRFHYEHGTKPRFKHQFIEDIDT